MPLAAVARRHGAGFARGAKRIGEAMRRAQIRGVVRPIRRDSCARSRPDRFQGRGCVGVHPCAWPQRRSTALSDSDGPWGGREVPKE